MKKQLATARSLLLLLQTNFYKEDEMTAREEILTSVACSCITSESLQNIMKSDPKDECTMWTRRRI